MFSNRQFDLIVHSATAWLEAHPPTANTTVYLGNRVLPPDHELFDEIRFRHEVVGLAGEGATAIYTNLRWRPYERNGLPDFELPCTCTLDAKSTIYVGGYLKVSINAGAHADSYALVTPSVEVHKVNSTREEYLKAVRSLKVRRWAYHHDLDRDEAYDLPGGHQRALNFEDCSPLPKDDTKFYETVDWCEHQERG